MPYIGNPTVDRFVTPRAASVFSGDGSTTAFTLDEAVGTDEDILVSVDGVVQEPSVAYAVSSGTTLTFTAAPSSGTGNIFVNYLAPQASTITPAPENKGNFKGGGLFRTNAQSLTANITILATENANVTGPFTVASGVTLTIESGGTLVTI